MSRSPDTESWTCPLCERRFKVPVGAKLTACPDCQKKPTLTRTAAVELRRSPQKEEWFVQLQGEPTQRGPLSLQEVQELYRRGKMSPSDYVQENRNAVPIEARYSPAIVQNVSEFVRSLPVYTTENADQLGKRIRQRMSVVMARRIYGINFFADSTISWTDFFGGRSQRAEKAVSDIEAELLGDIRRQAAELGANAVAGFRLEMGNLNGGKTFMIYGFAQGTPVVVEDIAHADGAIADFHFRDE